MDVLDISESLKIQFLLLYIYIYIYIIYLCEEHGHACASPWEEEVVVFSVLILHINNIIRTRKQPSGQVPWGVRPSLRQVICW